MHIESHLYSTTEPLNTMKWDISFFGNSVDKRGNHSTEFCQNSAKESFKVEFVNDKFLLKVSN